MSLKPIISGQTVDNGNDFNTETIANRLAYETLQTKSLSATKSKKELKDPKGIIPNGIYKVFSLEKSVKLASIIVSLIILLISGILITLFATTPSLFIKTLHENEKVKWGWYIIPSITIVLTFYLITTELIELIGISRSVIAYRESIELGAITTPPFITLLYRKLILKQVRRTWLVVAIIFYVGIFTLIFWGLKEVKWKQLDFKKWIHNSFPNPEAVIYILCAIMGGVLIIHISFSIFRKKRTVDIQSFFGNEVMDYNEVQEKKSKSHKFYAKIFLISILLILILPFIIYIILKKTIWRGK